MILGLNDECSMIGFKRFVTFVNVLHIIKSSFVCVSLSGMYMFAMYNCCDIGSWNLMISSLMAKVFGVSSCKKLMLFLV